MLRRYPVFILLFISPLISFSQANLYVGLPYAVVDAEEKHYFHQDGEILAVKIQRERITIQKFNSEDLSFGTIKVYEDMPSAYQLESVRKFNNRFFVFYSFWDKQHEVEQLYYREIDFGGGAFIGKGERIIKANKRIASSPGEEIGKPSGWSGLGIVNSNVRQKFDFKTSFDESKMLIQYRIKPHVKIDGKNFDIIGINVFDNNLDYVWNNEVRMPYTEKMMNNLDYSVDSDGNAYILASVFNDNTTDIKKGRNGKPNYHIELIKIKANTGELEISPVETADKFINQLRLCETVENEMVAAGFYNRGDDPNNADGVISFRINKTGEPYDVKSYEIPVLVLNQSASPRVQKKNEKRDENDRAEFEDLKLRELKIQRDGSILLIGEQFYIREHTSHSYGRTRTSYTYHYNDILAAKISQEGELLWMKKLPKKQVGRNGRGGMSYEYVLSQKAHYFVFLDNDRNRSMPLKAIPQVYDDESTGILSNYKIDDELGEVSKTVMVDTKNVGGMEVFQLKPDRIVQVSENEIVFEAYKKRKEDVLVRIGLEK